MARLTRWEGQNPDGSARAVLVAREGSWPEHFQEAMAKLAALEDANELSTKSCPFCGKTHAKLIVSCELGLGDHGRHTECEIYSREIQIFNERGFVGAREINFCPMCGRYLDG